MLVGDGVVLHVVFVLVFDFLFAFVWGAALRGGAVDVDRVVVATDAVTGAAPTAHHLGLGANLEGTFFVSRWDGSGFRVRISGFCS